MSLKVGNRKSNGEVKMSKAKYKIRYQDAMTTYLLDETFNSEKEAEKFIDLNLGEGSCYKVEVE